MRPKQLLLDVDGVILEFVRPLLASVGLEAHYEEMHDYTLFRHPLLLPHRQSLFSLLSGSAFWAELLPVEGAVVGVETLRSRGYDIQWVTSPWHGCREWTWVRERCLRELFPWSGWAHLTVTPRKELVQGDYFVDDSPPNVERWQQQNPAGVAFLMDRPWNRASDFRRTTWPGLLEHLR